MIYLAALLISMFSTIVLIPIFTRLAIKLRAMDIPNERKVHKVPMPKAGGISIALGAMIPIILWGSTKTFTLSILIGAWIVVLSGLIDDIKDLNYKIKFLGQLVAALIVVVYGGLKITTVGNLLPTGVLLPDVIAIPLTLVVIVGVTNAINLSDGLDGLAGGICLLSFLCIGFLSYKNEYFATVVFCVAIIGAILGFLRYNTFPATIFMGDAGSQLLGFLLAILSLSITQENNDMSPVLPLLMIGLPIIDTLLVMGERIFAGKSPFHADKKHLHHKLLNLKLFHNESVVVIYFIQAFLVTSAFIFRNYSEWFLILYYSIVSVTIILLLAVAKRTEWNRRKYYFFDRAIKGRLRILKEKFLFIKISFRIILFGVPALFIFSCILPSQPLPRIFLIVSSVLFLMMVLARVILKKWPIIAIKISLYLSIPFIVYLSEIDQVAWMSHNLFKVYNLSFLVLAFFVILTLRFSRREGFKSTPMDFLILFIAFVIPNLPDEQIKSYEMGMVAVKIIIFFFSFEVIIGELRDELNKLAMPMMVGLGIISLRGILGI